MENITLDLNQTIANGLPLQKVIAGKDAGKIESAHNEYTQNNKGILIKLTRIPLLFLCAWGDSNARPTD
jgi:hypothetical protein